MKDSDCMLCIHQNMCPVYNVGVLAELTDCKDYLPLGNVVQIVRCKDCKHYKTQNKSARWNHETLYCMRSAAVKMKPDDFCSYGERREE